MDACLRRTRKAVLDVLIGVGAMIAMSGWLIRGRAAVGVAHPVRGLHDGLLLGLMAAAVASYLFRRSWSRRPVGLPPVRREARFFWSHVGAAAVAAIGPALGLAYGWFVDPSLEGVAPFWVVPMAMGALAFPRRGELDFPDPDDAEVPSP
jgi:hypothetical protein